MAKPKKDPHWSGTFILRVLLFAFISSIIISVGTILHESFPNYTVAYASLCVGLFFALLYKAWEG